MIGYNLRGTERGHPHLGQYLLSKTGEARECTPCFRSLNVGFPGGPVVKNPRAHAGDTGSSPCLGRFHMLRGNKAHAPELLKPVCPRACGLQRAKPQRWEACTLQLQSSPYSLHLEKAHPQHRRPSVAKNQISRCSAALITSPFVFLKDILDPTCKAYQGTLLINKNSIPIRRTETINKPWTFLCFSFWSFELDTPFCLLPTTLLLTPNQLIQISQQSWLLGSLGRILWPKICFSNYLNSENQQGC